MSIFQAKEWWGVRISANEEFDERHLIVDNIDNAPDGQCKIIVASFSGVLRIYQPQKGQYSIEHLLFELNLGFPIMQIQCGNFKKTGESVLCVLFFKKIAFYSFTASEVGGLQGKLIKEQKLDRNAFNMCVGQFGGVKGDFICVQSCDAMLMIYEPDKFQCMCQLSTEYFPLPGALTYNYLTDAFVLQNSCYELECYNHSLGLNERPKKTAPRLDLKLRGVGLKDIVCPEGNYTKYFILKKAAQVVDLVVITEQLLFVITQNGTIRSQKKFDYPPATIIVNEFKENQNKIQDQSGEKLSSLFLVISSFTHHIMVYQDFYLLWAAKLDYVCHGLQIGEFNNQKGLLTLLNDSGWLQVLYLGTDPPTVQREFERVQKLTYQEMDQQYNKTLEKINQKEGQTEIVQEQSNVNLTIKIQNFDVELNSGYVEDSKSYFKYNKRIFQTKISITISTPITIENLVITIQSDKGTIPIPNRFVQDIYHPGDIPLVLPVEVFAGNVQPVECSLNVIFTWQSKAQGGRKSQTNCQYLKIDIPFGLYCYLRPPTKQAENKITLTISQPVELFQMFLSLINFGQQYYQDQVQACIENPNAMTLCLCNGQEVTVLVSKNLDKWRIQSNSFESIQFLMNEIILKSEKNKQTQLSYVDQIPLQDIFNCIDEHYTLRQSDQEFDKELESKTVEFRNIQKKLLSRFKEKNPSSSLSIDLLLQTSFEQLMLLIDNAQKCKDALQSSDHKLKIVMNLFLNLTRLRFGVQLSVYKSLQDIFLQDCSEGEIGWEETVYNNINYYLRSMMKKESKEQLQIPQYAPIEDTNKLKKIITILLDKISKGTLN